MPPRWIGLRAGAAGTPSYSYVLFERNTNDNVMFGNPHNFSTRLLHLRDMLEYFGTKRAIKRGVGSEIEVLLRLLQQSQLEGSRSEASASRADVVSGKYCVSNREKCPSLALMSSTDRRFLGDKRRRSFVRAFSSALARYFSRFLSTLASAIYLRFSPWPRS